jgi:hypothetical protein
VRFEKTPAFDADWARLAPDERRMFKEAVREFSAACDRYAQDPNVKWPGKLRVKKVESAEGVFELTWSFSGPDGRATWEWTNVEVEKKGPDGSETKVRYRAVRWRRVGTHRILASP